MSKLSKKLCGWILFVILIFPLLYKLALLGNLGWIFLFILEVIFWAALFFISIALIDGEI